MDNYSGLNGLGASVPSGCNETGLSGLGNINTDNASPNINTDQFNLNKTDTDLRKITTSASKFATNTDFTNYMFNFLNNSGVVIAQQMNDEAKQQLNYYDILYVDFVNSQTGAPNNNGYALFCAIDANTVSNVVNMLTTVQTANIPPKRVIIGFFNKQSDVVKAGKQVGIQIVDISEIYEINNAVDLADKKMPYIAAGATEFGQTLAKALNAKYKATATGGFGQSFSQGASNFGNGAKNAFSDGLDQLKESFAGLGAMFSSMKNGGTQQNVQQTPVSQQYVAQPMNMEQAVQAVQPVAQESQPTVSLEKTDMN